MLNTIYLDQNALQYYMEGNIYLPINDELCYVYSDEHFKEMKRLSPEKEHLKVTFLNALRELKARKIYTVLGEKFTHISELKLASYVDPEEMYIQYNDLSLSTKVYDDFSLAIQAFVFGNLKAIENGDLSNHIFKMLQSSIEDMKVNLGDSSTSTLIEDLLINVDDSTAQLGNYLNSTELAKAKDHIKPINATRRIFSKTQFSSLSRDNGPVIDQIWELIRDKIPENMSKDSFFGKTPFPFLNRDTQTAFESIMNCYLVLNMLGFNPDQGLTKVLSLAGINSDATHVAYAGYCGVLISGDERLCKKAKVVYEYLNRGTQIIKICMQDNKMSASLF